MKRVSYILIVLLCMFVSLSEAKADMKSWINEKKVENIAPCLKTGECTTVCGYELTYSHPGNPPVIMRKNLAILYSFNTDKIEVVWDSSNTLLHGKGKLGNLKGLSSNSGKFISAIWESKPTITKDSFVCPKNAYIGEKSHVLGPNKFDTICFDDNGTSCIGKQDYNFNDKGSLSKVSKSYDISSEMGDEIGPINKENLDKNKDKINNQAQEKLDIKMDFDTSKGCESYLGNPKFVIGKDYQDPAYYLQFVFNLMKYAALILLFVFTAVEFGKAMVSNNQDAMKKAIANTIKRLIIAIIIFFLPVLIEFILQLLGIYQQDGCGIS